MKKYVIIIAALIGFQTLLCAQDEQRNRIASLRIAFITNKLSLTQKESQDFWPIYNGFKDEVAELRQGFKNDNDPELMSDVELETYLDQSMLLEEKQMALKRAFIKDLRSVISIRKVVRLQQAENEFKRKLLNEQRKRRMQQRARSEQRNNE